MMRVICTAVKFVIVMAAFIGVLIGLGFFFSWLGEQIGVTRQDVTMWSGVLMLGGIAVALAMACWESCAPKSDGVEPCHLCAAQYGDGATCDEGLPADSPHRNAFGRVHRPLVRSRPPPPPNPPPPPAIAQ